MHKNFYASGFLYHLPSQQILLQQSNSEDSLIFPWELLGKEYQEESKPEIIFKNILLELLNIHTTTIYPIYSYFNEDTKRNHSLLYATTKTLKEFSLANKSFRWFSFKEILKLKIAEQVKHDILVGQRVIEARGRQSRGEHTLL